MADPIPEGSSIGISFDYGELDPLAHNTRTYGQVRIKGLLPLLLPQGQYKPPPYLDDPTRLRKLMEGRFLKDYGGLLPDDLDEDIIAKFSDYAKVVVYTNPTEDIESPAMLGNIAHVIIGFVNDDIVDDVINSSELMSYEAVKGVWEGFEKIYRGHYATFEEIPVLVPTIQNSQFYLYKCIKELEAAIPGFYEKNERLFHILADTLRSLILLKEKNTNGLSLSSRLYFGGINSGGPVLVETNALCRGIQIPKEVREDGVLKRVLMANDSVCHMMNDVFGLARDMKKESVKDSTILSLSLDRGIPLQTAYDIIFDKLKDELLDMRWLIVRLRACYKGDEVVDAYLRVIEEHTDGQFHAYQSVGRYEGIGKGMKVVAYEP